ESRFAYAFTNQLNAFIGLDYAYDMETEDRTDLNASPQIADIENDGLANPMIGVNYRLMNQNNAPFNLDFGAVARIAIEDAEEGVNTGVDATHGNFANGRNSLELNARLGQKWNEANEWQVAAGLQ